MMLLRKPPSHSWWFDSHNSPRRSPWLQSTLSELDDKTKAMLKLIEEDADSFAQRAEMFYKKRPELVNMVEDFYRAHRSLAERYDQLRSEPGSRLTLTPSSSPFSVQSRSQKPRFPSDRSSVASSSECESEVDDPEEEESQVAGVDEEEVPSEDGEVKKLREEVERLLKENRTQKAQMMERNEEKREAIRQLCLAMDMLKEENVSLRKCLKDSKKRSVFEFSKWKGVFSGKIFSSNPKSKTSLVAL